MKKIEKDLIFKDLDYINNEYDIKVDKLKSIVNLFLDEEPEIAEENAIEIDREQKEKIEKIENDEKEKERIENEPIIEEPIIEDIIENDTSVEELPTDIKTLYRKIVMITHPDKNKNKSNNEYYSSLYGKVIRAKDENDKAEIIYIAYKLKINEIYDIDDEHFQSIKNKIKEKEKTSSSINYNSFWIWYHTDNKELKKVMAGQIAQMTRKR
jgi:hypothetical protein